MQHGVGLGRAGAYNAFFRMGWVPRCVSPSSLPRPDSSDLLIVCESARIDDSAANAIDVWIAAGGLVIASGTSGSWPRFLGGTLLEHCEEANPYSGLAYILDDDAPQLIAPARWSYFRVDAPAPSGEMRFGHVAEVHGERQSPERALISVHSDSPAAIRNGCFLLLNADPFGALQSWLQGQEDLNPWLSWRHRLFWLDELVGFLFDVLARSGVISDNAVGPGIPGLGETTVVLRHDLDHSRDTTYLDLESAAGIPGVHAVLKDANTGFWRSVLGRNSKQESAFHFNTARYSRVANWIRRRVLGLPSRSYLPARSEIAGVGLLRQVRWAKRKGIGIGTLHRHLSFLYYPEIVDALDMVFRSEPDVLGSSSFYRGQLLRWGAERADGAHGTYAEFPDAQFPYWFPFRLAHAGDGGRILDGWETTSMMEVEPDLFEQLLNYRVPRLPQRIFVLTYHPAHANRPTFVNEGCAIWFRHVLNIIGSRDIRVLSMRRVFEIINSSNRRDDKCE